MRLRLLITTLWVGSLWTIGYLVAPTLFSTLQDRILAGTIAGKLFRIEAWLSVACGLALVFLLRYESDAQSAEKRKSVQWLILGMLVCTVIGYFGLQPFMAALRESAGSGGVMPVEAKAQFGILHGISSAFYLMQSLLGAALVLRVR